MHEDRVSETALAAAALRAAHRLHDDFLVFDDAFAAELTSESWRDQLAAGTVGALIETLGLRRIQAQLVGRMRYLEDELERALGEGLDQYVLLGAGLDAFAWRRPDLLDRLRVIELDHPATQDYKRRRLEELGRSIPEAVELVPVDFERTSLDTVLSETRFDPAVPAFFSWMGVVGYLTHEAFEASIRSLANASVSGSRLLFDYPIAMELVPEHDRPWTRQVDQGTASLGEQRKLKQRPDDVGSLLAGVGFERVEDLSPSAFHDRYFEGRSDGLTPNPEVHLALFRRAR